MKEMSSVRAMKNENTGIDLPASCFVITLEVADLCERAR